MGVTTKFRNTIAVVVALAVVAIAISAWFVVGNNTSYPTCTSLEYGRLQSLWSSVSMPSGASVVSGPTKSCTTRGLGKLTTVSYVVNAGSKANYLAIQDAYRSSLAKHHLAITYTADDQLYMARSVGHYEDNTAFEMLPAKSIPGSSHLGITTFKQIEDAQGEFLAIIAFQDAEF
jgi:hypothetical protein